MKHILYMPSEDDENKSRIKEGKICMKTTSKRLEQRMRNNTMRIAEQQIDSEINEFFKAHESLYGLPRIHIIHNSHQLSNGYDNNVAKYKTANGLTIICLEFKLNDGSIKKLFHYSVCDLEDFYSRLEGRLCAKSRLLRSINNSLILNVTGSFKAYSDLNLGLYSYPKHEKDPVKDDNNVSARNLLNWVIKHKVNKTYKKFEKKEDSLALKLQSISEENLLNEAKEALVSKHNLDPKTVKVSCDYLRLYHNPSASDSFLHLKDLLCTIDFFNNLKAEGKKLLPGGFTAYFIKGVEEKTGEMLIFMAFSICNPSDVFNKSFGRKLCLQRFKGSSNYAVSKIPKGKDLNLKSAIPKVAEKVFGIPVNMDLNSILTE